MRSGRPLLAAAALSAVTLGAAYTFGPQDGAAEQRKAAAAPGAASELATATTAAAQCRTDARYPKRQLRGIWIATVNNIDWPVRTGQSVARQKADYVKLLDSAAERRINAVFLQVRPASDALYRSGLEPWSKFLTGTAGKDPGWDPMPFLIDEAHKRGMEFHAWFNPYRAAYDADVSALPASHPARVHPDWVVKHEGRLYYNPGLPAVRDHVTTVIKDVVRRYDIDGVHFDDYFYPYPGRGTRFKDGAAFARYGNGAKLADWRRANVNKLVAQVDAAVHETKKHVKFGISPFGIWRNKSNDPAGSATSGMSAYDSIYADARHWIRKGTVDYVMPQLYWPRGFRVADYDVLMPWWARQVEGTGVHLYIGQALYRVGTTDTPAWTKPGELPAHLTRNRKHPEVRGDVYFSATQVRTNPLGAMDRIAKAHYSRPALMPLIKGLGGAAPAQPADVRLRAAKLSWKSSPGARAYAVYRVASGGVDACSVADARNLVAVVPAASGARQSLPVTGGGTYLVSALDRLHNESAATRAILP
ncbi:glycosyl hydrolase [Planomonospora parontospora subsp. parontospora]|uniref:Glycosyl hydrolase n=2 Tax=Planomonospora parontospora TaxID=58119 RepID=A0AA37BMG0_9ACTN|nr:family 10 glycosylhydrolase [Planomonospora parontospora]GGK91380.1 glycosyl hydrolase [Planomonospora parontospora]GII11161.1 glycosyl hydrolase [Planomonospora parontospora subsp. parontospora]